MNPTTNQIKPTKYKHWVSSGCGTTRVELELNNNKTFKMNVYRRWMGGNNWEWNLSGTTKHMKIQLLSKKTKKIIGYKNFIRLNANNLDAKNIEKEEVYNSKEINAKIKLVLMKEPKLTKLASGEEEWIGWGGSWNDINDAEITAENKDNKNIFVSELCSTINNCELTNCNENDKYVRREFFRLTHNEKFECKNHKELSSVDIVFENCYAVSNRVIEFLFEKLLKEEKIPETLYVDGSDECAVTPFGFPKDFPTKPIVTLTRSPENNFMVLSYSKSYHIMQVIKNDTNFEHINKFNKDTKRLTLIMDSKRDTGMFKRTDLSDPINEYLFLTISDATQLDYHDMYDDCVKIVCQIPRGDGMSISEIDFGRVSYKLIKDGKGMLKTCMKPQ